MTTVQSSKNPIGHLPVASLTSTPTVVVPTVTGNGAVRTLPAPAPGLRPLIIAGVTVAIDPTMHSPQNVIDRINNANIPGVSATLDRYRQRGQGTWVADCQSRTPPLITIAWK
jgi:hypothetical protein